MSWKKFKYIYLALFLAFITSGVLAYFWMFDPKPQTKPQISVVQEPAEEKSFIINSDTKLVFQERYEVCEKYNLLCEPLTKQINKDERQKLNGLSIKDLKQLYDNRQVTVDEDKELITIVQKIAGLCPEHKNIWHLGLDSTANYVTIYYGPSQVKNEGGIYKITEIPIDNLDPIDQEKIRTYRFEFYQEEELVAILDSFSEFLD